MTSSEANERVSQREEKSSGTLFGAIIGNSKKRWRQEKPMSVDLIGTSPFVSSGLSCDFESKSTRSIQIFASSSKDTIVHRLSDEWRFLGTNVLQRLACWSTTAQLEKKTVEEIGPAPTLRSYRIDWIGWLMNKRLVSRKFGSFIPQKFPEWWSCLLAWYRYIRGYRCVAVQPNFEADQAFVFL